MQSSAVARFVVNCLLSRPCFSREAVWSRPEAWLACGHLQNASSSQQFSTAETDSRPSDAESPAVTPAVDQQKRPEAQDTARLAHAEAMRKLRRKWSSQHAQRLAVKAEAEAKKSANKAASEETHRAKKAQMKEIRVQIHEEKRRLQAAELAQRQAIAAEFRAATQGIYSEIQARRRAELLEESKDWITPETLDARINEALDNPIQLYDEVVESDLMYRD